MRTSKRLSPHDERRAAVAAGVDPRTVRTYIEGGHSQRSTVVARIETALRELGLEHARSAPQAGSLRPDPLHTTA